MNVLIPTMPDDMHAIYVHLALKKLGYKSLLWYTADFPTQQTQAFFLKNNKISWIASGSDLKIKDQIFDVVWYRRPRKPILSDKLHPADIKHAVKENAAFTNTVWNTIFPDALWINSHKKAMVANCKLLQLKAAAEVGFDIPDTLISNSPALIKKFIKKNDDTGIIYKTLTPQAWEEEKKVRLVYTETITLKDLPLNPVLQMTPGIFQKKINKSFELRVTMMGNNPISVKINSQKHPKGELDWRFIPTMELSIEKFVLPYNIKEKCIKLMEKLGLEFGCIDFIVTPKGEYYFLEVNEQGQFLWIEEVDPNIKMLNSFVRFLIGKTNINPVNNLPCDISMKYFGKEAEAFKILASKKHKNPETF